MIRSLPLLFCVAILFSDGAHAAPTKLDTNREVIRTYVQVDLESKQYGIAEDRLKDYLATDDQDGSLWNLLGLTQLLRRNYPAAAVSFSLAAKHFPDDQNRSLALYNLSDAYFQGAKTQEAKSTLRTVMRRNDDYQMSAEIALDQILARELITSHPLPAVMPGQRGRFRLSTSVASGFDTNVLLVNDIAARAGAISGAGSAFITPGIQTGYVSSLWGERLDTRVVTSLTNYLSEAAKSYNLLFERADVWMGTGNFKYGITQDVSFINRDPFQLYAFNAGPSFQKRIALENGVDWRFELPIRYRYNYFDRTGADQNNRSGYDVNLQTTYVRTLPRGQMFTSQLTFGSDLTDGKNFRLFRAQLPTTFFTPLPGFKSLGVMNSFGVLISGQYYYQSDTGRRDWMLMPTAGLSKAFDRKTRISLDYALQKNFSTLATARYLKHLVTLMVTYDWY